VSSYDVVVIGAGPAGSAAAYHASRHGLRVLIIDRLPFPRQKTCGDALTPRALAALRRMGIEDLPGHRVRGVRIVHDASGLERYDDFQDHPCPHTGLVVERTVLDSALLERARTAGAVFRVGNAQHLLWRDGRVSGVAVASSGCCEEISVQTVIMAIGSRGATNLVGTTRDACRTGWGIAGRTYLEVRTDPGEDLEIHFPVVQRGRLLSGYAWIFPVGPNRVNLGVGVFRTANRALSIRSLLGEFLRSRLTSDPRFAGAVRCGPIASAPITIGPTVDICSGLVPIGDSAGLANPFTAEGIAAALESGEIAARALLVGRDDAAECYADLVRAHFPRHFSLARALPRIHAHPWFVQGRGFDVVSSTHETAGSALRRMVWDEQPRQGFWKSLEVAAARDLVAAVRSDIIRGLRRLRPAMAEMATYLIDDPKVAFGWFAAFGASVRVAMRLGALPGSGARRGLVALEVLNLVRALHLDLLPSTPGDGSRPVWGRNTLSLVLADCLTAYALEQIYRLDSTWCRYAGTLMQRTLRQEALARLRSPRATSPASRSSQTLFIAAAAIARGAPPEQPLAAEILAVASTLAKMRDGYTPQHGGQASEAKDSRSPFRPPFQQLLHTLVAAPGSAGRGRSGEHLSEVHPGCRAWGSA
jgi:geranylgeranyl reductase family protein